MTQNILVTGAAGYIGSVMVPALLEKGFSITALDLFPRGDAALLPCCAHANFTPVKGDVRDEALMKGLVAKADIVIQLAAVVGAPLCKRDPLNAQTINSDAVRMLLKIMSKSQKLLYPATDSAYGISPKGSVCTEETPLNPITLYGTSKVEAERAIVENGNGICFRLATVFGLSPRMRFDLLVNDYTYRALTDRSVIVFDGHLRRYYVHVRDVVKAFVHGLDNIETMIGQVYNVGLASANLTKLELCAKIKEHIPDLVYYESPDGEDWDKRDYFVSPAKLEATGWTPDWTLDIGIEELMRGCVMLRNNVYGNV